MSAHTSLVSACVSYLQLHGIRAYPVNQVAHHRRDGSYRNLGAPSGLPDIVACVPVCWSSSGMLTASFPLRGQFLAIECKTGKSKPRADQIRVLAELAASGATVAVITSVDQLEPIVKKLTGGR